MELKNLELLTCTHLFVLLGDIVNSYMFYLLIIVDHK